MAVLLVDADAVPGGDGLAWATAYDDLQGALTQAAVLNEDGDPGNDVNAIWIADGTYTPSALLESGDPRSTSFSLLDGVTLYGGFNGSETTLEARKWATRVTTLSGDLGTIGDIADNAYTVVYCGNRIEAVVDGLTITGGFGYEDTEEYPVAHSGGGIYNSGTLTVVNSTISENTASGDGGGVYNGYSATLIVTNSTLSRNSSEDGGGIYNYRGAAATVTNSVLNENSALDDGGGIYNRGSGTLTLT